MSRLRTFVIIWLVLVCGLAAVPASAQNAGILPDLSQLPGLETAVGRAYVVDFSQAAGEESGNSSADYRDALFLPGMVMEFGDATQAAAAYQVVVDHGVAPLVTSLGIENPDIVTVPLADLGDQAIAFVVSNGTGSIDGYLRQVVMQQANYVFLAFIVTEAEESSLDADALVAYFSDQVSAAPSGPGTLGPAADSTGGLWDFFPPADHALYAGLIPDDDEVIISPAGN